MVSPKRPWLLIVMVVQAVSNSNSEDDCLVRHSVRMDDPGSEPLPLLAYLSRSSNVTLGFIFPGEMADRDAVCLNSTGATHSVVRNGKHTWMPVDLPRLIPEGWNTFTVVVAEQDATVTLVQGPDQLTLLTLPLPHRVTTVFAEGTVARCTTLSPEWEVTAGREAKVVLQPGGSEQDQWMEMNDGGLEAATFYVSFPFSPKSFPVPANTILRVTNSLRGDHALLRVFKDNDGDGEEVVEEKVPITSPLTLLVSSVGGEDGDGPNLHLRLMLSPPLTHNVASTTSTSSSAALGVIFGTAGLVLFLVVGAVIYWRSFRMKKRLLHKRKEKSVAQITPKTLAFLSQQKDFVGRIIHTTTNGLQTLHLHLLPDIRTEQLLDQLSKINTSQVELLLVSVPEASRLLTSVRGIPALPDIEKVKLRVAGFTKRDLAEVCDLVKKLQPLHGYAVIDFEENTSSSSGDGETLLEEEWEKLLRFLEEKEVPVKGKVWLPTAAIAEERQTLLPLRFSYGCRSADQSLT